MLTARLAVKACLVIGLLQAQMALAAEGRPHEKVSFYFAAHQDDWQLFMNPSAFLDVANSKTKTVFIHTTAGDAGSGVGSRGRKHPFYLARENGAETAIRFMADAADLPLDRTASAMNLNGHQIYRVSYRNTVGYFLRLPDGNPAGTGYKTTGNQSLKFLADEKIKTLSAVDGSTVYQGWTDLVATVRAILDFERGRSPLVQLNVAETDPRINPGDHSDHLMTAKAALDAAKGLTCVRRLYFVNYASSRLPENLNSRQRDMESSVFAVTAAGIRAFDHSSNWDWYNHSYVGRNYFRAEEAAGRCGDSAPELLQTVAARPVKSARKRK